MLTTGTMAALVVGSQRNGKKQTMTNGAPPTATEDQTMTAMEENPNKNSTEDNAKQNLSPQKPPN